MIAPPTDHIDPDIREYLALREAGKDEEAEALWERMQAEQEAKVRARVDADHERHLAFHGRTELRSVVVERSRGRKGRRVCGDCYYGKEWDGR